MRIAREHGGADVETEQALVRRLIDAWHAADVTSIVALLTEDALLTMPPQPECFVGRDAARALFVAILASMPRDGRLDRFRLLPTRANRQPAVALYYRDSDDGAYLAHAVVVLAIEGDSIASLTRFADPNLFGRFGLPPTLGNERVPLGPSA